MIGVRDVAASRKFYEKLGFETVLDGGVYAQLVWPEAPNTQIGLMQSTAAVEGPFKKEYGGGMFIALEVADVEAVHAELKAKGLNVTELSDAPWGQRRFSVQDPDGVALDIGMILENVDTPFVRMRRETLAQAA